MDKIYGAIERNDGIQQIGRTTFEVFYGFGEDENGKYQYRKTLPFKPTFEAVREMVLAQANANVQEKITSGFKWKGLLVWLSETNQLNYARDFNLVTNLVTTSDQVELPTYKFGTDETPVYYTFETYEELKAFNEAWSKHISDTIAEGWHEKANINWEVYRL